MAASLTPRGSSIVLEGHRMRQPDVGLVGSQHDVDRSLTGKRVNMH